MEPLEVRTFIRAKLRSGRLPLNNMPSIWGGPSNEEECDACGQPITDPLVIEGIAGTDGSKRGVQMHVLCFALWNEDGLGTHSGARDAAGGVGGVETSPRSFSRYRNLLDKSLPVANSKALIADTFRARADRRCPV